MLPSENRLRRREDFAAAVRRGRRAGRPLLVVHLRAGADHRSSDPHAAGEDAPPARAGFVVSKAVGNSVVRNRVQRRLRHLVRARLARLPAGSLVVVRALPGAAAADSAELAHDLDAALRRLAEGPSPSRRRPQGNSPSATARGSAVRAPNRCPDGSEGSGR